MTVESDERLASRAAGGDKKAFEALVLRHRVRVFRVCYRMAGNVNDAEDWAQECFVRIWTQLKSYDSSRGFEPWMLRGASNTCKNLVKSRTSQRAKMVQTDWEEIQVAAPSHESPHEKAVTNEQKLAIEQALQQVSPVLRQAMTLWAVEQLSFKELAEVLGVPLWTAAQRVRRGLIQVRSTLAKKGHEVKS